MKKVIVFLMVIVSAISLRAENNSVSGTESAKSTESITKLVLKGTVTDPSTDEVLAGATVMVNGKKTYTDFDGNFTIETVKGKDCEMTISMISYRTEKKVINPKDEKKLEVKLKR